jgi:hypothetical protein
MNVVERFAYATGRAVGAGLREFLDTMFPAADQQAAEAMRSDIWGSPSTHEVGTPDLAPRTMPHLGETGKGYFQITQPQSMDDALAGVDDEVDWFDWARPAISEVLESGKWMPVEWIDTVSAIIAEKIASDPAKAIAALWNYQLSRNETT